MHRISLWRSPPLIAALLLAGCVAVPAAEPPAKRPAIFAHRGLAKHAPENTLANFRACLDLGLGIELDVRRAKDGALVCIHDSTVDRTTTGKGKVADYTLAELQRLDAGSRFDPAFNTEHVPSMAEVFALVARHPRATSLIAVDLKEAGTEADLVALARKHGILDRLVFIGLAITQAEVRRELRKADAKAHVARLVGEKDELGEALKDADADWIYVRHLPSRDDVAKARTAGKRLLISGPKVMGLEPDAWKQAQELGFDAILTDYPLELAAVLRGKP
ncbi:MAG: hypothetical protein JNM56_09155 [Planctomycetia bacterium]|nr:hypothetical protein [Planctomycetia bacterium]